MAKREGVTILTTGRNAERSRGRSGFTLLELVLVMLIMCTVLAMAAPSLRGFFSSRRTSDAASQIVALTQLARSQAVSEGRVYRLNLDTEEGTYWLTVQQGGAFERIASEFGRMFSLPDGTTAVWQSPTLSDTWGYVQFHPDGTTDPVSIRLNGPQGESVDIACQSATEFFEVLTGPEVTGQ